ncbi:MAG: hypothetical protein EA377_03295 [Phycisphaerales bacterium]|nr:MAG: hypothetical protein EA377_03295 [Phycisphaerales bacterium]
MTDQSRSRNKRLIGAIAGYFGMVYGAGFVLGVVRTLWLTPWLGGRWAELLEMPVMFCAIVIAAHLVVKKIIPKCPLQEAAIVGLGALGLLLIAEVLGIWLLRGEPVTDFIINRDPLAGSIFLFMLLVFAIVPAAVVQMQGVQRRESCSKQ